MFDELLDVLNTLTIERILYFHDEENLDFVAQDGRITNLYIL